MQIFVISKSGKPLMPTKKPGKVRRMLKDGRAKIVGYEPFTIRLTYETTEYTQPVTLGIDAGYQTIGYSAITDKVELIGGKVEMLWGMSKRLQERAMYRRKRRERKRYRKPRFKNRRKSKPKGWLAPSIQHKLDTHLRIIEKMRSILPITRVIIEVASFDIQKIRNPDISGTDYQKGEQAGFWNVREYVLHRDGHRCQNPNCKKKTSVLQVHHIGYWKKDYTDRPGNLITLCVQCHTPDNHQSGGFLWGWQPKVRTFRAETFMSTVRWRLTQETGALLTFGYVTKSARSALKLAKSHHNDAFVIAGGTDQLRAGPTDWKQRRRNNRRLETFKDAIYIDTRTGERARGTELHCGRRTRNRNLNGENLRQHRGQKVRKGIRSIRRRRYSLRPGAIVLFEGERRTAKRVHAYGKRVYLEMPDGPRSVGIEKVVLVKRKQGLSIEPR